MEGQTKIAYDRNTPLLLRLKLEFYACANFQPEYQVLMRIVRGRRCVPCVKKVSLGESKSHPAAVAPFPKVTLTNHTD